MVFRLKKALYGLKKAHRTQYSSLEKDLTKLGFSKGMADSNLYWKEIDDELMMLVIFVDDIIFRGDDSDSDKFAEEIKKRI